MLLTSLKDAFLLTLLAFPLAGFDLVQRYGEAQKEIIFQFGHIGEIFAVVLVIRLGGAFLFSKRLKVSSKNSATLSRFPLGLISTAKIYGFFENKLHRNIAILILFLFVSALPFFPFTSKATVDVLTLAFIYIILGLGLNIVVGLAGLLDLGYVGFYAVGAYGYGLLYHYWGWSFWEALPGCGLLAAIFGVVLGFPVLRLRGDYLAIVTLGFGEIIRIVLNNWDSFTNGPNGIMGIPKPSLFGIEFTRRAKLGGTPFHEVFNIDYNSGHKLIFMYFLVLLMVIFTIFVIQRLQDSRLGRAWIALREDEVACEAMGINTTLTKLSAFGLGACWAGFAGSFYAARQGFINPESFTFIESATILAIVVLGGMGSTVGVCVAALAIIIIPELAREFSQYRMLIFAMVMVALMIFKPEGLLPARRKIYETHPEDKMEVDQEDQAVHEVIKQ